MRKIHRQLIRRRPGRYQAGFVENKNVFSCGALSVPAPAQAPPRQRRPTLARLYYYHRVSSAAEL